MNRYVIDTHTLLWYCGGSPKISSIAKQTMIEIINGKSFGYLSAIVIGEAVAALIKEGEEEAIEDLFSFLERYKDHFSVVDVSGEHCKKLRNYLNKEVVIKKKRKRLEIHDSLIMILAQELGTPVITKDEVIKACGLVEVVW